MREKPTAQLWYHHARYQYRDPYFSINVPDFSTTISDLSTSLPDISTSVVPPYPISVPHIAADTKGPHAFA